MQALFVLTILINALLLFLIQPMIAKMLLPFLGGSPSVWNTCMVFFQAVLLAGYAYSHLTTARLKPKHQIILHLMLLLMAALIFPVEISEGFAAEQSRPVSWLFGNLLVTVGPPFFMLSSGGSLLQQWFSRTDHPLARDPYFLYSASNLGSLVALLGYPLLVEPNVRLRQQTWFWAAGYCLLVGLFLLCAITRWRSSKKLEQTSAGPLSEAAEVCSTSRLRWIALSFAPSSLMLGVTTYLTTDISPIPLLWVMPLAIYLLTFILAFARRPPRAPAGLLWMWLPIYSIVLVFLLLTRAPLPVWLQLVLHLLMLFFAALLCHARLAETRPPAAHLTEFYLWVALGGVLGGLFNSLMAPILFDSIAEYPLAIVLALALRRNSRKQVDTARSRQLDFVLPAALGLLAAGLAVGLPKAGLGSTQTIIVAIGLPLLIGYAFARRPFRFALAIGAVILGCAPLAELFFGQTLFVERNFFGVLRVAEDMDGKFRHLYHGATKHGSQFTDPRRQCEPLAYYHRRGPLGQAIEAFAARPASPNVAVIGLGSGAMACYARPGQHWVFYEIDPAVRALAQHKAYFTYLQNCSSAEVETILGDARLQLRHAPDRHFDLIALDAFSSDAIPAHLLTLEALNLYLSKMADGGRLAFHLSNKYVDLLPVIADLAKRLDLTCLVNDELKGNLDEGQYASIWAVLSRHPDELETLTGDPRWRRVEGRSDAVVWTDDFSNVFSIIKWY